MTAQDKKKLPLRHVAVIGIALAGVVLFPYMLRAFFGIGCAPPALDHKLYERAVEAGVLPACMGKPTVRHIKAGPNVVDSGYDIVSFKHNCNELALKKPAGKNHVFIGTKDLSKEACRAPLAPGGASIVLKCPPRSLCALEGIGDGQVFSFMFENSNAPFY